MMNTMEHLLAVLGEEGGEVAQMVGKCLRFGLNDFHPKNGNVPNIELLDNEVNEVFAVAEMLGITPNREKINAKKERVRLWMEHSRKVGALEPGSS